MVEADFSKQDTLPALEKKGSVGALPQQIGPYKIESLLEKGGMSLLYLATHPETNETITIKVLFPEYVTNPEMVARFSREAEIIALADHPNIVKLYGQGTWEKGLYIAMEYIQGISLRQYLLRNLISLRRALEIIMEISMALCHLHAHGVIHRDLKPENIIVTESGGIKVIDFGIAQLLTDAHGDPSSEKRVIGTPIYMSPEQRENPESTSYPSDIYSLGIITYELVLGKLSHGQIHLGIMPKGLRAILSKALQQKPSNRYQDIVDFMTDLSEYLHSPAMLKENKELAPLGDLSESLKQAERALVPTSAALWPGTETGLSVYKSFGISTLYYDFLEVPSDCYGIIMGEPSVLGPPNIVYISSLRGMVRALTQVISSPKNLATSLNQLLHHDPIKQSFAFSYLFLNPFTNQAQFISCGCGRLWRSTEKEPTLKLMVNDNPILGIDPHAAYEELSFPWKPGDTLLFYGSAMEKDATEKMLFSEEALQPLFNDMILSSPQAQVDHILKRAKIKLSQSRDERSLALIGIKRLDQLDTTNDS